MTRIDRIRRNPRLLKALGRNWELAASRLKDRYPTEVEFGRDGIHFPRSGLRLVKNEEHFIFRGMPYLQKIQSNVEDFFVESTPDKRLLLRVDGVNFIIESKTDLFIISEIFADRVYDFSSRETSVVFDIGMNVGIASLFFARQSSVQKVIGFEPVDETVEQACKNFNLNPELRPKIEFHNVGLSRYEETKEFRYDPTDKGSFGYVGNERLTNSTRTKKVKLAAVGTILRERYESVTCGCRVMKMDCEGAEIEIIPELIRCDIKPEILMLEWHLGSGFEIACKLGHWGYKVFNRPFGRTSGIIYAVS